MKRGDKITVAIGVVLDSSINSNLPDVRPAPPFRQGVYLKKENGRILYRYKASSNKRAPFAVALIASAHRHVWWAKGWDGPEVDALKASVALR